MKDTNDNKKQNQPANFARYLAELREARPKKDPPPAIMGMTQETEIKGIEGLEIL